MWPGKTATEKRAALAADTQVTDPGVVKQWHLRNSIPAEYWPLMVAGAKQRGIRGIAFDRLASLAAARRQRPRPNNNAAA